jgi:hypothetical protein
VAGDGGELELVRVDGRRIERMGPLVAANGERPIRLHDLVVVGDGRFFAGENDHRRRSSHLWEVQL